MSRWCSIIVLCMAVLGEAQGAELDYVSMRFIDIRADPQNAWSNLDLNKPLAEFDCWVGGARTTCVLPSYSADQLLKFNDWGYTGFDGEELRRDEILSRFQSDHKSRHRAAVFKFKPIPAFPGVLMKESKDWEIRVEGVMPSRGDDGNQDLQRMLSGLVSFDRAAYFRNIRTLSIADLKRKEGFPVIHRQPLSFESVRLSSDFEEGWTIWKRLSDQTTALCPNMSARCRLTVGVVRFVRGPKHRSSGYAVCDLPNRLGSATMCRVVAYSNDIGDRYVLVLYGPIIGIPEGGSIGTTGMLEMGCYFPTEAGNQVNLKPMNRGDAIHRIRQALASNEFSLAIPAEPKYSNRARILSGVNDGKPMALLGGKFAYFKIDVDADSSGYENLSVRMFARANIRAERNPGTYPVVSIDEAATISNAVAGAFEKVGFKCVTFNDQ